MKQYSFEWLGYVFGALLGLSLVFFIVYSLAMVGEPQSVWLMCDILSLCEATK